MAPPPLYRIYVIVSMFLVPFATWFSTRKLRRAGVDIVRAHERLGHATDERRGSGPLVWFHAASVGESLSVLALITHMGGLMPRARFLITSGTPTSAKLVAQRMPPRCVHQFAPLDAPGPVKRFLRHWRPEAAVFVESELWPQMLVRSRARGTRLALVNARLSARSRAAWARQPRTAAYVLGVFDLILSQNDEMAQAMVDMHAPADRVARGVNLKSLSAPLSSDPEVLARMRLALKGRPVWVAASTHVGEEEAVLRAHAALCKTHPDLMLILAPRHPERSDEVRKLIDATGLTYAVRSDGALPGPDEAVYLADTLGELGNWYALTQIVFLGGSLREIGGHNPFEVALAGAVTVSGPHVFNFSETYEAMGARGATLMVPDDGALAEQVAQLFDDKAVRDAALSAVAGLESDQAAVLDAIARRLIRALGLEDALQ